MMASSRTFSRALTAAALALAALATACGAAATPTNTPVPAADAIHPILGTTVLRQGEQRVAFILETASQLVSAQTASIVSTHVDGGGAGQQTTARFDKWPYGTRGAYVTSLIFDEPGTWRLAIVVDQDGTEGEAELVVEVADTAAVSEIGEIAPFSNTKTLESVGGDLSKLSSQHEPDPDLYRITVGESLFSGRPTVVVFASPAFCTSPTCGPQVETITSLKEAHEGEADFIHVEVYDNPDEIQGDLSRGELSPVLAEWGIDAIADYRNESWTFVIGRNGRIAARFEGFASFDELEAALQETMSS